MSPAPRRKARKGNEKKKRNESTIQQKAPSAGDPTIGIRQPSKRTGNISIPTEDCRHMPHIRFGKIHPAEHFSKAALARIPVDSD
jgi:hypothetical protein